MLLRSIWESATSLCLHTYTYTNTHIHTHIHINTYTNIHIYMSFLKDVFCDFLDFTRCHCLQLFPAFLNKKLFALQSSEKSISKASTIFGYLICPSFRVSSIWWETILCSYKNFSMIPGATYVYLDYTDYLDLISGFCVMIWKPFYLLLTKGLKDFCFAGDKNIIQSTQYTGSTAIL